MSGYSAVSINDDDAVEYSETSALELASLSDRRIQQTDSSHSSIAGDETAALVSSAEHDDGSSRMQTVDPSDDPDDDTNDTPAYKTAAPSPSLSAPIAGLVVLDPHPPRDGEVTLTIMRLGGTAHGNIQLNVALDSTIGQLVRRVYASELAQGMRVRIVFMGRMCQEAETLASIHCKHGNVLHSLITAAPPPADPLAAAAAAAAPAPADGQAQPDPQDPDAVAAAVALSMDDYPGATAVFYSDEQLALMRRSQELAFEAHQFERHRGPPDGTLLEFVVGIGIGFVLSWIAVLWLINASVSRKQRLGVLLGIAARMLVSMNPDVDAGPTDATNAESTLGGANNSTAASIPTAWQPDPNSGNDDYDARGLGDLPTNVVSR